MPQMGTVFLLLLLLLLLLVGCSDPLLCVKDIDCRRPQRLTSESRVANHDQRFKRSRFSSSQFEPNETKNFLQKTKTVDHEQDLVECNY